MLPLIVRQVRRDEIVEAVGKPAISGECLDGQDSAGLCHLLRPDEGDVNDIRPLAHDRLAQELIPRVAPRDGLQIYGDSGIGGFEFVQRRAHLIALTIVEAERQLGVAQR